MEDRGTLPGRTESPAWTYLLTKDLIWEGRDSSGSLHQVYDAIQYDPVRALCLFKRIPNRPECKLYQSGWTNKIFERVGDTWREVTSE